MASLPSIRPFDGHENDAKLGSLNQWRVSLQLLWLVFKFGHGRSCGDLLGTMKAKMKIAKTCLAAEGFALMVLHLGMIWIWVKLETHKSHKLHELRYR